MLALSRPLQRAQALDVLRRIAERLELTLDRQRAEPGHASTRQIASPAWSAPEEIERDAPSDARTDVWAIGLIALRSLTGRSFWSSDESDYPALAVEVTTSRIPRASERLHELAREPAAAAIDAWFARCVERDPAARFACAADAVARLARALPIEPAAPPRNERPRVQAAQPARGLRSPGVLFAVGLLASVPIALVVFIVGFGAGARLGAPAPRPGAPRSTQPPPAAPVPAPPPPMAPLAPRAEPLLDEEEIAEVAEPPLPAAPPPDSPRRSRQVRDPGSQGIIDPFGGR